MTEEKPWRGWLHHMGLKTPEEEASIAYYRKRRNYHFMAAEVARGAQKRHEFQQHLSARQLLEAEATG